MRTGHALPFLGAQSWVGQLALKITFLRGSEGKSSLGIRWKLSYVEQQSEMSSAELIGRGTAITLKH